VPWKLKPLFPFLALLIIFRYCMALRNLKRVKGGWKKYLVRLLQYITSLMILLIAEDLPVIVALLGGLQVQPYSSTMPWKKEKNPLSVSHLFYGRSLINGILVGCIIVVKDMKYCSVNILHYSIKYSIFCLSSISVAIFFVKAFMISG
jgi:hypothetical protein